MAKKTFTPDESDVRETREVFHKDICALIDKVNRYWYNGDNRKQAIKIIKAALDIEQGN